MEASQTPETGKSQETAASSSAPSDVQNQPTFRAEVTEEYEADDEGQLTVKVGEIVTVYGQGEDQNGWYYGHLPDGRAGYFPSTYVTPVGAPQSGGQSEIMSSATGMATGADLQPYSDPAAPMMGQPTSTGADSDMRDGRKSIDPSTSLNLWTLVVEWITAFLLFFSGCFCIAYGSTASKTLGSFQLIISFGMFPFLWKFRDDFVINNVAVARAGIWIVISLFCWTAAPVGVIAGGACFIAAALNGFTHIRNSPTAEGPSVYELVAADVESWGNLVYVLILAWFFINIGFWVAGKNGGDTFVDDLKKGKIEKDEYYSIGSKYGISSGFSTVISVNIMFLIFFCCRGLMQMAATFLGGEGSMPGRVMTEIIEKRDGYEKAFCVAIFIGTVGHVCAIFQSYVDSDDYHSGHDNDFGAYWGSGPFATACFMAWTMIMIYSTFHGQLRADRANPVYLIGHDVMWPLLIFFTLLHGRKGWNHNFWKYMIAPLVMYAFDRFVVRAGYLGSLGGEQQAMQ